MTDEKICWKCIKYDDCPHQIWFDTVEACVGFEEVESKPKKYEIKCATCKDILYEDDKRQKTLIFCSLTCSEEYKKEATK